MGKGKSKTDIIKEIEEFFLEIKNKTPKKIKKLAMRYNVPLKEKRKTFCKKCFTPYENPKIRIKNKIKSVTCENCGSVSRWRIKSNSS
ncbi:MAG: hypothetical protein KJ905_01555 [Nanoarchaeota archaeon]|nr:hypothetical protein [Nanoarchaeota archaeon]MBU1501444.1 hypothetical protein [Nanoarchaeota archaeon]